MNNTTRTLGSLLIITTVALGLGCESTPNRGDSGGRTDPYGSTDADRNSNQASFPALLEFSDQVAAQLVQDLMKIPGIRESETQVILELGGISNKTRTPSTDFEIIQRRVRNQLLKSDYVLKNVAIVENRQRLDREIDRIANDQEGTNIYDPSSTYVLLGDFMEANRGGKRYYYFDFTLTELKSRRVVFNEDYDLAQQ